MEVYAYGFSGPGWGSGGSGSVLAYEGRASPPTDGSPSLGSRRPVGRLMPMSSQNPLSHPSPATRDVYVLRSNTWQSRCWRGYERGCWYMLTHTMLTHTVLTVGVVWPTLAHGACGGPAPSAAVGPKGLQQPAARRETAPTRPPRFSSVPETTSLFALLWRARVIRHAHAASHVPSGTAGEHDTPTPVLMRPRGRVPTSESGVREHTPHFRRSSRTTRIRTKN